MNHDPHDECVNVHWDLE